MSSFLTYAGDISDEVLLVLQVTEKMYKKNVYDLEKSCLI